MKHYPKMLYRKGDSTSTEYHGLHCETCIVDDADEEAAIVGEGWRRTPAEAHGKEPDMPAPDVANAEDLNAITQERNDGLAKIKNIQDSYDALNKEMQATLAREGELKQQLEAERAARAAAEKERDESRELIAAFDRDNDGKPGGSKKAEKQAEKTG